MQFNPTFNQISNDEEQKFLEVLESDEESKVAVQIKLGIRSTIKPRRMSQRKREDSFQSEDVDFDRD